MIDDGDFRGRDESAALREEIFECYRLLDDLIGNVLDTLDADTDLFIISDHGFGPTEKWFNVNTWLDGLAAVTDRVDVSFSGKTTQGLSLPANLSDHEYEALRNALMEELTNLKDPLTGRELMDRVITREEAYEGPYAGLAPDILFTAGDYSVLGRDRSGSLSWLETCAGEPSGFHRTRGVFLSVGERIRKNHTIEGARIIDVMPTILRSMGEAVPEGLDGKVLEDIFENEFLKHSEAGVGAKSPCPARTTAGTFERSVRSPSNVAEAEPVPEIVMDRLRGLGYIE